MRFFNAVVLWLACMASIQAQISVVPTVKHLTSTSTPSAGAISLTVSGGASPYSYTWTPGNIFTKDISNIVKNTYVVKVKDSGASTVTYTYNIGYKAEWDQMYGCISRNDSLISDATYNWAQAITKNNLAAGTDGWVEYILKGITETKVFGVLDSLSPLPNTYADIDYGFYYEGSTNNLYEIHYGGLYNVSSGLTEGAALRIERNGSTINFLVNGLVTNTVSDASASAKVWKAKAMIWASFVGASFVNLGCSFDAKGNVIFKNYSNIIPYASHSAGSGLNDGSVSITPLKSGTYTYTWQPGSVTSASITSKSAGEYTLIAKDAINTTTPKNFNIGYKVNWDQKSACLQKHDTLITTGFATWGSAISKNTLSGGTDGWFEYVLRDMDDYKIIGFTDSLSPDVNNIYDIDFGFYYELGTLYSFGLSGYFAPVLYNVNEGTVLRVERIGDTVVYKLNGAIISSGVYAGEGTKSWKVKGTVYAGMNSSLINVGCSFYAEGNSDFPNYTRLVPTITHASSPSTNDGGVNISPVQSGTYTYTWQPGSVSGPIISSKAPGAYAVAVKDALNHQNTRSYNIGYKVKWDQMNGCKIKHDTLVSDQSYTWGRAISKNTLTGGTDGWMEYVMKDLDQTRVFGFSDSLSPLIENYDDIDYGFNYDGSNQRLYIHTNGLNAIPVAINAPEGTVLRIERKGDSIYFKINNLVVSSGKNSEAVQRTWKIKAVVYAGNASSLINVGCSFYQEGSAYFPNYNMLIPTIVHSSGVTPGTGLSISDGSLKVRPMHSGTGPYIYTWQPGGESDTMVVSKKNGNYSVMVQDGLGHQNKGYYHMGYKTVWDSLYGCVVYGDTLKTTSVYSWGRAISKNTLAANANGWFEYVLEDLDKIKLVGFLDSMSTDPQDIYDIDYGYYYDAVSGILYTDYKGSFSVVGRGVAGSVLRVERRGDAVMYTINGVLLGSIVDAVDAGKAWNIKGIVHGWAGTKLVNVGCSFDSNNSIAILSGIEDFVSADSAGSMQLMVSGGVPPYDIAWNGAKLPSNNDYYNNLLADFPTMIIDTLVLFPALDSLRQTPILKDISSGIYNNKIYDATNDSINFTSLVGVKLSMLTSGISESPCTILPTHNGNYATFYGKGLKLTKTTSGSDLSYAVSNCVVTAGKHNVYTEFKVNDVSDVLFVGLKTASTQDTTSEIDMVENTFIQFTGSETTPRLMKIYYMGSVVYTGDYTKDEAIGILLDPVNKTLSYYKNSINIYTKTDIKNEFTSRQYQLKVLIKTPGAFIRDLIFIGDVKIKLRTEEISGIVSDASCETTGSLTFVPFSMNYGLCDYIVTGPDGYSSSGILSSSNVVYGLLPGVYTVTIPLYYSGPLIHVIPCLASAVSTMTQTFEIAYVPDWINLLPLGSTQVNVIDRSFAMTAAQSNPYLWPGGASSRNILYAPETGWAEFKPLMTLTGSRYFNLAMAFGLNDQDLATHPSDIDHFFYVKPIVALAPSHGLGSVFGSSASLAGPYLASMAAGGTTIGTPFYTSSTDVLKLKKVTTGTSMKFDFYKNNALMASSSSFPIKDLVADIAVNQVNVRIVKPRLSFGCEPSFQYAVMKKKLDGGYYAAINGQLFFKYDEEYNDADSKLKFNIYNPSNSIVYSSVSMGASSPLVAYGDNRYSIDLSNATYLVAGQTMPYNTYYTLEVINEKNEKWYLRFRK